MLKLFVLLLVLFEFEWIHNLQVSLMNRPSRHSTGNFYVQRSPGDAAILNGECGPVSNHSTLPEHREHGME